MPELDVATLADEHVAHGVEGDSACREKGKASVELSEAAENGWVEQVLAGSAARRAFQQTCTPSYANREGRAEASLELNTGYGGSGLGYLHMLEAAGADGRFPDLVFS